MNTIVVPGVQSGSVPSNEKFFLGSQLIRGFLQGAVLRGYDPQTLLQKAGLAPELYQDPEAKVDGVEFQRLFGVIQKELNDIFLGFLQEPAKPGLDYEQSRARMRSSTLGEAIRTGTQFREAVRNDIHYRCIVDEKQHEFSLHFHYCRFREGVDQHLFYWSRLMLAYRYHSWLIGERIQLSKVGFAAPAPQTLHSYLQVFRCPVAFDQPCDYLSFDKKYLACPIIRTEAEQGDFVANYPDWFTVPGEGQSLARRVEQTIRQLQQQGMVSPTIDSVADKLVISTVVMRRHLSRENQSFQKIKNRLRCEDAIRLLVTTDLSVTAIAAKIGFAEPGDFTRAFVGWTNMTPSAYRAEHQ